MPAMADTSKCSARARLFKPRDGGGGPNEEPTEGALLHFCLRVTDVEASYARALAAGAVSRIAPRIARLGGEPPAEVQIAFVVGPNGEVIEFLKSAQL